MRLKDLGPKRPGQFEVQAKTRRWFAATEADQPAASTFLSVAVGPRCFSQVVTKKTD